MPTRLEESLERDIERIRQQVLEMSALAERALRDCVEALSDGNRQRAYAVILRDQYIDEKEKEIDRLCLEFLVRQQPVGDATSASPTARSRSTSSSSAWATTPRASPASSCG